MRPPAAFTVTLGMCAALLIWAFAGLYARAQVASSEQDSAGEWGPHPTIPQARKSLIPTVNIAKAEGWPKGMMPRAAPGTEVDAFATGLDHPRWLYVLPNGDVLVAEADAPPKPEDAKGVSGAVHKHVMKEAGSGRSPSANRITLLRAVDGAVATRAGATGAGAPRAAGPPERHVLLEGLNSPIGMALIGDRLYVANTDAVVSFPYHAGQTEIRDAPTQVTALPGGPINHHWTKSLIANRDGTKLYVGVGSNSNVAEHGLGVEQERAAVWEIDPKTGAHRVYASGLRNPVGLAWEPESGVLWVAVNERDELGDHVPPDYMTGLREGAFYGWPFSYYGDHVDERVKPQDPAMVAKAIAPDYALGAHTASLGLCWAAGSQLPEFRHGMFVGQHGSWNRKLHSGYRVIFVPFEGGKPSGEPVDVLTGFLDDQGNAFGRPVGVAVDKQGALLVADDVGNTIWRVSRAAQTASNDQGPGPGV